MTSMGHGYRSMVHDMRRVADELDLPTHDPRGFLAWHCPHAHIILEHKGEVRVFMLLGVRCVSCNACFEKIEETY